MTKPITPLKLQTDSEFCECAETMVEGTRVPKPRWHNCEYIRKVNAKIIGNCTLADRLVDTMPEKTNKQKEDKKTAWQQGFSRHMDFDRYDVMREMEAFEKTIAKSITEK